MEEYNNFSHHRTVKVILVIFGNIQRCNEYNCLTTVLLWKEFINGQISHWTLKLVLVSYVVNLLIGRKIHLLIIVTVLFSVTMFEQIYTKSVG